MANATLRPLTTNTHRAVRPGRIISKFLMYIGIIFISCITLFPFYWMIVSALQPNSITLQPSPPLIIQQVEFKQFAELFADRPVGQWIVNSLVISTMAMIICVSLTVLGAYTLSSLRWRGRNAFGLFLLVTQMLPGALIIIPLFIIFRTLNISNNLPALGFVDTAFVLPVGIWILKGVFDTVPTECFDAALVDGANEFSVLWYVVLPLSTPGLVAVAVVSFFGTWNEFLFAVTLINDENLFPVSIGLQSLTTMGGVLIEQYFAAGLIFSILPVVFYLAMQRYIVSGLTAGAVKG